MIHNTDTSKPAHRFAVIGGDGRMTHLAEYLAEAGYPVNLLGCGDECLPTVSPATDLHICTTLNKAAEGTTVLILPLPASRNGETVHCPRDPACTVALGEVTALMKRDPKLRLFGGKIPEPWLTAAADDIAVATRITDYNQNEIFLRRNAEITAEAAVMTAMELTDTALQGSSAAVVGYGRIGRYLARLLGAFGTRVTVCARREESLFQAVSDGHSVLRITGEDPFRGLQPLCRAHRLLFNTVPARILSREWLLALPPEALLVDLASAPFGVAEDDVREATARNRLHYLRAPSLPGSYAPRDAGRAIGACILHELEADSTNVGYGLGEGRDSV